MRLGVQRRVGRSPFSAFSLIEATTVFAVVGVGFVGLYAGITFGITKIRFSRETARATQIVVEKMESLRLFNWEQITGTNLVIPRTFVATYHPNDSATNSDLVYNGTFTITNVNLTANYTNRMRLVTVSVSWRTGSVPRTRSVSTYVSQNGIHNSLFTQNYH